MNDPQVPAAQFSIQRRNLKKLSLIFMQLKNKLGVAVLHSLYCI